MQLWRKMPIVAKILLFPFFLLALLVDAMVRAMDEWVEEE